MQPLYLCLLGLRSYRQTDIGGLQTSCNP